MNHKIKVLVVEDEALTAMSLKMDLESLGVEVLKMVAMGEEAVTIAHETPPSLVLMDIRLAGGMDGIEAAEAITKEHHDIPIVFMSGFATDYIKRRADKLNPLDFLEKPLTISSIKLILERLVN